MEINLDIDDNHSKTFISEKDKYYIRGDNKSIHVKILNKFKDIRKSYEINAKDITDNFYKIDKPCTIKYCTILLIDDIHTGVEYIFLKKIYIILDTLVILVILLMMIMIMMIIMNQ